MSGATGALLRVDDLCVAYGEVSAVAQVALHVPHGSIVTIIGPNGAGKTTMLASLMGLLPAHGRVAFDGTDVTHATVAERVERGIALVPESRDLFADMTVRENLLLGAFHRRRDGRRSRDEDLAFVFSLFPRLAERLRQRAGTLSGGERQMLAIGRALMGRPRLLMLDEPSLGLAPLIVADIFRVVEGLRATGVSILLVEQNARAALEASEYGYVLEMGRIVHEGASDRLIDDPKLTQAYLGVGVGVGA